MNEWLSILGLGEDGPEAMAPASRAALLAAEVVFGGPRHLALVAAFLDRAREGGPGGLTQAPCEGLGEGSADGCGDGPREWQDRPEDDRGRGPRAMRGGGAMTARTAGPAPMARPDWPADVRSSAGRSGEPQPLGFRLPRPCSPEPFPLEPPRPPVRRPELRHPELWHSELGHPEPQPAEPRPPELRPPELRPWPVPYSIAPVLAERGRRVVVLASGDPFWFGAGAGLAQALAPGEWRAHPAPSTFSHVAARLGWPLEAVACLGLHAAPLGRLRPHLAPGARAIVLLRDGAAVTALACWLAAEGFGDTLVHAFERLGGAAERVRAFRAADPPGGPFSAPVAVALDCAGGGRVVPLASGRPDDLFDHDGQITRRPVRALALSALAPRPGERLWDIGAGSGSIAIEWLMAHPSLQAVAVEAAPARAARIRANADRLGADRLVVREGRAPEALAGLPPPQAVFIGGGADPAMLEALWARLPEGTRIVAHAVTLETEALFTLWQGRVGGSLLRVALAEAGALGRMRGWRAAFPVVQWTVTR